MSKTPLVMWKDGKLILDNGVTVYRYQDGYTVSAENGKIGLWLGLYHDSNPVMKALKAVAIGPLPEDIHPWPRGAGISSGKSGSEQRIRTEMVSLRLSPSEHRRLKKRSTRLGFDSIQKYLRFLALGVESKSELEH